jgi:hypothetical protein
LRQANSLTDGQSIIASVAAPLVDAAIAYTPYIGIALSDNASNEFTGNRRTLFIYGSATNFGSYAIVAEGNNGTSALYSVSRSTGLALFGNRAYLRFTRKASNLYTMFSLDGEAWNLLAKSAVTTFSYFYLFVAANDTNTAACSPVFPINWLRHVNNANHDPW